MINRDLIDIFLEIAREKNIERSELGTIVEELFLFIIDKETGDSENCSVIVNLDKGEIEIYAEKTIVDHVDDDHFEITLERALELEPELSDLKIGDTNIAFLAKIASIIACLCVIGVALTPANIRSLYALHILSANSIFYFGGFGSILFGYLFLKSKVIDDKYGWILILYGISTAIYIYILFFGPKPWESVYGLTVQASAQKAIFLIGFFTNWMTIKAIGLLDDKV